MIDKTNAISLDIWDCTWYRVYDVMGESLYDCIQFPIKRSVEDFVYDSVGDSITSRPFITDCVKDAAENYFKQK
jgi:hypothetical protein